MQKLEPKELIFVSGKGGTGKSTVAAVLAANLGRQDKKVLLVELGSRSSIKALLSLKTGPHYKPSKSGFGFEWALMSGLDCLVEYVSSFTKLESMTQKFFESTLLKNLINVAPGLNDLAILGKLTSQARGHGPSFEYDHVIVDAPSTGSFQSLIQAPMTLGKSVTKGPLHTQSFEIDEVLRDQSRTQFIFVSLYEELPMDELEDTLAHFDDGHGSQTSVIMNKKLPLVDFEKGNGDWTEFVKYKLEEEERQKQRLKDLWKANFSMKLHTVPLNDILKNAHEGVVRPI